jgi:hypothetical protein
LSGDNGGKTEDDRDHRHGGDPQKFHGIAYLHVKSPLSLIFWGSCFAWGMSHGDLARVSGSGYAQGNIHRWQMTIIFEREGEERKWRDENRGVSICPDRR